MTSNISRIVFAQLLTLFSRPWIIIIIFVRINEKKEKDEDF